MVFTKLQEGIAQLLVIVGVDEGQFKILLCTLLSFPFSAIFKRLPDRNYLLKNLYVVGVATFYIFGILDLRSGLQTLLISSGGCYFITRYLRTSAMPWINFLFLIVHLAYNHFHTQFFNVYDPKVIDITGAQMVLVMKLSAFGWNVHDGKQPKDSLTKYTRARAIKKHPNLLPYIGYVFFYPSMLTGPAFDYVDYDGFIHSTLFDDVPLDKRPGKGKRRIPRSGRQAAYKVLQGFMWAVLFVQAPKYVDLEYLLSGNLSKEHNFVYRIFYLWALGLSHRLKYYTIWLIAEGACVLCGIGYNGYDVETDSFKWNRVQNIDPWSFETGQNVHACLEAWNMNTNKWLKHYVYARIARKGKRPGFKSTLFTFATSAFWHGTRPGYYLTFVMGAFIQTLGRIYRLNFRPMFLEKDGKTPKSTKVYYDVVCWLVTQLAFGFISQPFVILDFKQSVYCWSTVYFYVPVATVITLFVFKGPYSKKAVAFCKQFHASNVVAKKEESKLSPDEVAQVGQALDSVLSRDSNEEMATLGLPPIDVLETATKEDFDEDMKELSGAWKSFRSRKGSFGDDLDGLKDAYTNFTSEINEIFHVKKAEIEKKKLA